MSRYALFLRGVNVGGVTVTSAALRECLAGAGFTDVRTVLASGNAMVTTTRVDRGAVRARAEGAIEAAFGRAIGVVALPQAEVAALVAACPYEADSQSHHAYVVLVPDAAALKGLRAAVPSPGGYRDEDWCAAPAPLPAIYWWYPRPRDGERSMQTPVASAIEAAARGAMTTTRNVRTMRRLMSG
ncbi:DUF1697 domain-containing protein [Serinibacter salmoneus]|uniref:DUF1697 domain-containing protein n=1 Tax=Serinibacter salmoneus TaxID=556530 RepID=UPI00147576E3|nr:DUF1697 domain-containing protein [Serinibacter salmoneus]